MMIRLSDPAISHTRAAVEGIDRERRTARVTWSTGADVLRNHHAIGTFIERLSMDPAHVRLARLNSGAPLLNAHQSDTLHHVLGVVVEGSAHTDGRVGTASVRFSQRADVAPVFADVCDRVIRGVSVGYKVHGYRELEPAGGQRVLVAEDWEPYELSLVPLAADPGASVRERLADADRRRRLRLAEAMAAPGLRPRTDAERSQLLDALVHEREVLADIERQQGYTPWSHLRKLRW